MQYKAAIEAARAFTGFVFLSIFAFYLSELVLEPFAGHIHGLTPDASTKLSGGKDGASLAGMIAAGVLSTFGIGTLRGWAVLGCVISAVGLVGLGSVQRRGGLPGAMAVGIGLDNRQVLSITQPGFDMTGIFGNGVQVNFNPGRDPYIGHPERKNGLLPKI